jgi:type VI secretion system protein ImpG
VRGSPAGRKHIEALIEARRSEPTYSRIRGEHGLAFARGHRIDVELDEEQFAGGGVYLFASVLERFFGMYTSSTASPCCARAARNAGRLLKEWPPRSGSKPLL